MKLHEVKPNIFFVDAPGAASNNVYLKTSEGVVVIDTTTSQEEMSDVLKLAGLSPADASLVINTHADGDHVLGNGLFNCPIAAHQLTYNRMKQAGRPAEELPGITFSGKNHTIQHGEFKIELVFVGGHKTDMTMAWLPEQKVLFTSDIMFQGRFPYILQSDVPRWIEVLKTLAGYQADVLLPGHGTVCAQADLDVLTNYLETTWQRVGEHFKQGTSLENILADPNLPRPDGWIKEDLFKTNIEYMLSQLG